MICPDDVKTIVTREVREPSAVFTATLKSCPFIPKPFLCMGSKVRSDGSVLVLLGPYIKVDLQSFRIESWDRVGRLYYIIEKPKFCYNRRGQKGRLSMKGSYDQDVLIYDKNDSKEEPRCMN